MKKRNLFLFISVAAGLILLGLTFVFFDWRSAFKILKTFSPAKFLAYFLVSLLTVHLHTLRHKIILNYFHQRVSFYRLFTARLMGMAFSYLIPSAMLAGEPVRGHVLSKAGIDSKISYASVILDKFWELVPNFILMVLFLFLAMLRVKAPSQLILMVVGVGIIYSAIFYIFYSRAMKGKGIFTDLFRFLKIGRLFRRLNNFEAKISEIEGEVTSFLGKKKKEFFQVIFLSPLVFLSWFAEVWLLSYFLGIRLSFSEVVAVQFLIGVVSVLPISGGIGVMEFGSAGIFSLFGFQGAEGLTFSLLMRIRDLLFVSWGLLYFLYFNFKDFTSRLKP